MADHQAVLRDTLSGQAAVLGQLSLAFIEPKLAELGINLGTFELLTAVQAARGQAKQTDIARRLGISAPSLCEALKIAVRKGVVEQVAGESDHRTKFVRLTKAGQRAIDETLAVLADMEALLHRSLDGAKVREATALLAEANRTVAGAIHLRESTQNR
jgi:MarR family transcriptional regulator for hemolysin